MFDEPILLKPVRQSIPFYHCKACIMEARIHSLGILDFHYIDQLEIGIFHSTKDSDQVDHNLEINPSSDNLDEQQLNTNHKSQALLFLLKELFLSRLLN